MGNRLYVGNLSYQTTAAELRTEFEKCGTVRDAHVVSDRESGRSRGFGFVEFATEGEAQAAIQAFDQYDFGGRSLTVKIAEDRPNRSGGSRPSGGGGRPQSFSGGSGGYNGGGGGGGYDNGGGGPRKNGGGGRKGGRRRDRDGDDYRY